MTVAYPWWLVAGLAACFGLIGAWRRYDVRQRAQLATFVATQLTRQLTSSLSIGRRRAIRVLLLMAIALLFFALAGPQAGYHWEQVTRRGNDVLFAVDTSRSMLTPDVKPNRLARAKLAIDDFVNRLDGDAVGLVAFAGNAFLQCPLTTDYGAFRESLGALDTHIIPRGGTDIASAIREAQKALDKREGGDKVLILVTDGEDLAGNALVAAKAAAQDGLKIYTVGVGTANGDLIALPTDQGGGFVKDPAGNLVKSRLDESGLKAIAAATGGTYAPLGAEGEGLEAIYRQALAPLAKHDLLARERKVYTQRYQWPLAAALGMLLASMLIGTRRRIRVSSNATAAPLAVRTVVLGALLSTLAVLVPGRPAFASTAGANLAYAQGNYAGAERDYAAAAQRAPNDPALRFNVGAAAYKAGHFGEAAQAFQQSVSTSQSADAKRLAEQENAYYDLGDALYRNGQKTEQSNAQQTIDSWTQALKAYDAALQLRATDADSKFNRDLVQRKLEDLKKKQSEQNQHQRNAGGGASAKQQQGQSQEQKQADAGQPQQSKNRQNSTQTSAGQQPQQLGQQQAKGENQQKDSQSQGANQNRQQPDRMAQNGHQQKAPEPSRNPSSQGSPPEAGEQSQPISSAIGQSTQENKGGAHQQHDQSAQVGDSQRLPGEMSREEARELLDSVKDEERRFPAMPIATSGANDTPLDETTKDW